MRRRVIAMFWAATMAWLLGAALTSLANGAALGFGLSSYPPTLNPHVSGGTAARTVKSTIYEGLMSYDADGEVRLQLAESVEMIDPTTYRFRLRTGVRFHGGQPFTSGDVVYTFERILDPASGAYLSGTLQVIESIEAPDDHTVVFKLKEPFAPFLEVLAQPEASIVSKAWMETNPDLNTQVNGTGPFRLAQRIPGVQIRVERNPDYYEPGLPKVDAINFIAYSDPDARLAALQTGQIQIMEYVEWRQIPRIQADPSLVLDLEPGVFQVLSINVNEGPLADPRVRQAIAYAVDREEIALACFEGYAVPLYGALITEGHWAYSEDLANYYAYDPEKARQLLAEAGYPDGFPVTILATSAYSTHYCPAEVVQAQLGRIGIDVSVELVDWPTRVERRSDWSYEIASDGLAGDYLDPDFYFRYFHSAAPAYAKPPHFTDAEVDRLLEAGRSMTDREQRKQIYHDLEKRLLELSPWIFLVKREQPYAMRAEVTGFEQLPSFLTAFSGVTLKHTEIGQ
ncbi:MAG: hypothetical protein H0Z37_11420 [Firmicutes bacterium]|nr:hypothetical protein [Bacillota bacterium]